MKEINGTLIHPPLTPYLLDSGKNQTFVCPWNWKHHQGRNITVTVRTLENYTAHHRQMTPVNLTLKITDTAFDPSDKSYFEVTIKNTENSSVAANITKITVSVDDKTVEMKELIPHLPKMLEVDSSVTFRCSWAWAGYQGEQVRILVETSQGYRISREVEI
ncbi:hypothetical protein GWN63_04330 [Candidatus Bathyarchaeota archaeon]|nr:hypothetical protein [Candidatus Bathyarchaeota archaeon]NIV68095.1 hypothetical protein [Candidatus Bathyarchaeota archaeon]NIW34609.1 hypothetical protein [Candidatus Bathyarchaeota archaeon]